HERVCRQEIMDQPSLEPGLHRHALHGLARINWLSGSDRILWKPLKALALEYPGRRLRLLDVASGGGDVPIRLWRRARRAGLDVEIHGGDISRTAVAHAQAQARNAGADVTFFQLDALDDNLPAGFDVVASSLFLHHL